eukprot:3344644-Lingulodinium_polyedra.AAC.1
MHSCALDSGGRLARRAKQVLRRICAVPANVEATACCARVGAMRNGLSTPPTSDTSLPARESRCPV